MHGRSFTQLSKLSLASVFDTCWLHFELSALLTFTHFIHHTHTPLERSVMFGFKGLVLTLLAASASADHHETNSSLLDVVASRSEFSFMLSFIQAIGGAFEAAVDSSGPFTLFLPTDDAVMALPNGTIELLMSNESIPLLTTILSYHAVLGELMAADLVDGGMYGTAIGFPLTITLSPPMVNGEANITEVDIMASNGIIHAIDAVLSLPVNATVG